MLGLGLVSPGSLRGVALNEGVYGLFWLGVFR